MKWKGVCYDVGRFLYGNWRKDYDPKTVHRELEIIKNDLHCNAVRICGKDVSRLAVASEYALQLGLDVWFSPEPRLKGRYVRDEALQAREITDALTIFDEGGVNGAFVFTFVFPNNPYNENSQNDLDMASYSLVKSYAGDKHGTIYPDMTWEPKESFAVVAEYYANH